MEILGITLPVFWPQRRIRHHFPLEADGRSQAQETGWLTQQVNDRSRIETFPDGWYGIASIRHLPSSKRCKLTGNHIYFVLSPSSRHNSTFDSPWGQGPPFSLCTAWHHQITVTRPSAFNFAYTGIIILPTTPDWHQDGYSYSIGSLEHWLCPTEEWLQQLPAKCSCNFHQEWLPVKE